MAYHLLSAQIVRILRVVVGGLLLIFLLFAVAAPARAQGENRFAIGAEVGTRLPGFPEAHGQDTFGLLWRFGKGKEGFGFNWGLNWYASDIDRTVGGGTVELGELHLKPFMAGYGYTKKFGKKTSATASLIGGFALTSISMTSSAQDAYVERLGARPIDVDSSATWALKPGVGVWYDINRKIGLHVGIGYMMARPEVTVTHSLGTDRRRVRADMFQMKVGLAYSVF
jgi:outer membrane protein with beta-barrel domain